MIVYLQRIRINKDKPLVALKTNIPVEASLAKTQTIVENLAGVGRSFSPTVNGMLSWLLTLKTTVNRSSGEQLLFKDAALLP